MRRYDQIMVDDGTRARMVEAEDGYWVWHSEHAEAIAALRSEVDALKAEIRLLGNVIGEMCE